MLFGPAILLIPGSIRIARRESTLSLWHITNALVPIFLLSLLPHQEARFLMPSVPLLLSSLHLPQSQRLRRIWIGFWIVFNLGLAIILGTYHQGGVVPMQLHLARQDLTTGSGAVVWWKCYSPPRWLLGERGHQFQTIDLQGAPELEVVQGLRSLACESKAQQLRLVAPLSANLLDKFNRNDQNEEVIKLIPEKFYYQHINPEDFDPRRHGFLGAVVQIWKQRGLGLWRVQVDCSSPLVY